MRHNIRFFMLMLAAITALLASAIGPYSVYADDGGTTGTPGEGTPVTDPLGDETPPSDEPSGDEEIPVVVDEQPVIEEPASVVEIVEQIPEGTDLVVLNEAGEVEPLATEAAAEIIATGDPMWCPSGATPGDAGCTGSFLTFEALITALEVDASSGSPVYTGAGVIWVEDSYNGNDDNQIVFDGAILTNLNNNSLTVQGGWSGGNNTTITGTSLADVSMVFANWTGNITLNDLDISAADGAGFGLFVNNTGDVVLDNVSVNNTTVNAFGYGDGAVVINTGNLDISNSEFDNNQGNGLQASSGGNVTLDTVSASGNTLTGAYLDNCDYNYTSGLCNGTGSVTVTSATANIFDGNGFDGLVVDAGGGIAIDNTQANNNALNGAILTSADANGTGNVTIDQSDFSDNSNGTGLDVFTDGNLGLTNVTASSNNTGAMLDTTAGVGTVNVSDSTFGDSNTTGNTWTGLHIESGSAVTLSNVVASYNGTNGAYVEAEGDIAASNSAFNENVHFNFPEDPGLFAQSNGGSITLIDVVADGNDFGAGAVLTTNGSGNISVTGTVPNGSHFNGNGTFGIQAVNSNGDITLTDVEASYNAIKGAYLRSTGAGNIFVTGSSFVENGQYGIYASSHEGNITLDTVTVTGDDGAGTSDNLTDIGAFLKTLRGGNVFVIDSIFQLNTETGLRIVASNQVDLTNVTADLNGGNGVEIYSTYTYGCRCPGSIVVNADVSVDGGTFTNNGDYGLFVAPGPEGTLQFPNQSVFGGNGSGDYLLDLSNPLDCDKCDCDEVVPDEDKPNIVTVPSTGSEAPVEQNCELFSSTILELPNGTWINVGCPYEGFSNLSEILEGNLPGALGAGTEFVDGIVVSLTDEEGNTILNEDGTVTINFKLPGDSRGRGYSVLFWDTTLNDGKGGWVKLPIFEAGTSFPLHPENPEDGRIIVSGVQQMDDTITFTVNFSGTFVLVTP